MKSWQNPLFLSNILFPNLLFLYKYSPEDLEIIRRFITECRLALNKKLMLKLLNKRTVVVKMDNSLFYVKCFEDLYHALLCYEIETLAFIESAVTTGGTFVDVGSNIGGYTIRLARKSQVYAFEPHPLNYSLLCSNLKLNNLTGATYNCAVSDTVGVVKLYTSKYHGYHSIVNNQEGKYIKVDAITLDKVLACVKTIDVLKIDVEGAEPYVFRGAINTFLKTKFVVFEGSKNVSTFGQDFLTALGFKYVEKIDFYNVVYSSP
jgi:FkbM family methyltransferase